MLDMLTRDSAMCSLRPQRWVDFICLEAHLYIIEGWKPKKMRCTVKNYDVVLQEAPKHCWKEDLEHDYFEQKIGIKPNLQPMDLQGELISTDFHLMGR